MLVALYSVEQVSATFFYDADRLKTENFLSTGFQKHKV